MIERIEAILNRLVAFSSESSLTDAVDLQNAALALEEEENVPLMTEACFSLCVDIVENSPPDAPVVYSVFSLLSRCCIKDENKQMASRFGTFGLCILLLRDHESLSGDIIFLMFDLMSTLAMNDSTTRRLLRPSIPYVVEVMKKRTESLQLAFAGSVVISTLTMLDFSNANLAVQNGCMQVLVSSFIRAYDMKKQISHSVGSSSKANTEKVMLYDNVMRWTRDALYKLILSSSPLIDEHLAEIDFGRYGSRLEVDELQWKLKFDRRKTLLHRKHTDLQSEVVSNPHLNV